MTADDLTRLRAEAERANLPKHPCGVCMGHSPEWDGHAPGCVRPLHRTFDPPTLLTLIDRVERAERERDELRGRCICNTGPNTDGPDETCPVHGREYGYWVEEVVSAQQRELATRTELAALRAAVKGLADEWHIILPEQLRSLLTDEADDGQ